MKIKKFNQRFRWLLVLVIIVSLGANSTYAAESKGPKLKVTMKDGLKLKGKLLSVSDRTLVVLDQESLKEMKVTIDNLKSLTVYEPRKNKFLKGFLFGLGSGISIIAIQESESEYKELALLSSALLGVVLGTTSTLADKLTKKSHCYDITRMSAPEIDALLSLLGRSCKENIVWGESYKDGLLSRIRISWRPGYKPLVSQDQNIRGDLRLVDDLWPGMVNSQEKARISGNDGNHIGRIRVDYALSNRLSLGFEYLFLEKHDIHINGDIQMSQDQQNYYSNNHFGGTHKSKTGLIGVNYEYPIANYLSFCIETGIGLSFSQVRPWGYYEPYGEASIIDSDNMVRPAFQLGVSVDISPQDPLSFGFFASYLYSRSSFKEIQSKMTAQFFADKNNPQTVAFTREAMVSIPGSDINLGGFTLGFVLRLR